MDFCETRLERFVVSVCPFLDRSLYYLNSHRLCSEFVFVWRGAQIKLFKRTVGARHFARQNKHQRRSFHSGSAKLALLHNYFFYQPCSSRFYTFADCFFTGIHTTTTSFVSQHQLHAQTVRGNALSNIHNGSSAA